MTELALVLLLGLAVSAALAELVRFVRADGYGLRCPPGRTRDLAISGLPDRPYVWTPPR